MEKKGTASSRGKRDTHTQNAVVLERWKWTFILFSFIRSSFLHFQLSLFPLLRIIVHIFSYPSWFLCTFFMQMMTKNKRWSKQKNQQCYARRMNANERVRTLANHDIVVFMFVLCGFTWFSCFKNAFTIDAHIFLTHGLSTLGRIDTASEYGNIQRSGHVRTWIMWNIVNKNPDDVYLLKFAVKCLRNTTYR